MTLQRITHSGAAPPTNILSAITATAMSFGLVSSTGYPTGSGGPFVLDIDAGLPTEEKVLCSSLSGGVVTVATGGRGWDGTIAVAHSPGTVLAPNVTHVFTSAEADDANAHIYDTSRNDHTQYILQEGAPTLAASGSNLAVGTNPTLIAVAYGVPALYIVSAYMRTTGPVTISFWVAGTDERGSTTFYLRGELSSNNAEVYASGQTITAADSVTFWPVTSRLTTGALAVYALASVAGVAFASASIAQVAWA